jgi:hypothetical protein
MFRACTGLAIASLVGVLASAPAAAQTLVEPLTKEGPFPGFERTDRDLGTWDAVLIGSRDFERRESPRFVEINERGCGGSCIDTRLVNRSAPWWPLSPNWKSYGAFSSLGLGAPDSGFANVGVNASRWVGSISAAKVDTRKGVKTVMVDVTDPRVDVAYPSPDDRIVTVYGETASSGKEVPLLWIVYTRRP